MDTTDKPSAPTEPTVTVGFNLPQEFQTHVNVSEPANPPANVAEPGKYFSDSFLLKPLQNRHK